MQGHHTNTQPVVLRSSDSLAVGTKPPSRSNPLEQGSAHCPQVWQSHPEEGGSCLVLMLEEKRECMNVQEEIQEQIVNSLRFLFSFIFSVYTQIAPIK